MPVKLATRKAEELLIVRFMSDRKLFGCAYCELQPDYFDTMPLDSGVFVSPLVRTSSIVSSAKKPGDIDLLIIPYERNDLVLHRTMAIEVKAVRASFLQPGKSPNEFGFSQAWSLLELGFPYVAVVHLIISNVSPMECWREMSIAKVLDRDGGAELCGTMRVDPLPGILTDRSFGRLQNNCRLSEVGLLSAYLFSPLFGNIPQGKHMIHLPSGRAAQLNPCCHMRILDSVSSYFDENTSMFLDNPRYDP